MGRELAEIQILPPFAIARLGSSAEPMDNYELVIANPIDSRQIVSSETLVVDDATGEIRLKVPPFNVSFRDAAGNIRPIAPFLEVWTRFAGDSNLVPLTTNILSEVGLSPDSMKWSVHAANLKAYRRTGHLNDRIDAVTGLFSDHNVHYLNGTCPNFLDGKSITFGSVRYIKPTEAFPEIRLRFTPASGKVYGPPPDPGTLDPNIADAVYDPNKGTWKGYKDPSNIVSDPIGVRKATNPAQIYAGQADSNGDQVSYGYLDDECDGIIEVELATPNSVLSAYARIAAGPPTFAPDSLPVRTVADELEQAMFGPSLDTPVTEQEVEEVSHIVRRALETVRLMNTSQLNKASSQRGVGMARMDFLDVNRALEPIADPAVVDSLAIRSRHERVLVALQSGSLAWFARALRHYDKVGDLSNEERRKMPALMRGADGRNLALTRRQVDIVRKTAEEILKRNKA